MYTSPTLNIWKDNNQPKDYAGQKALSIPSWNQNNHETWFDFTEHPEICLTQKTMLDLSSIQIGTLDFCSAKVMRKSCIELVKSQVWSNKICSS